MKNIKRGDIWVAALDPTIGSEIRKTRPAIIVSNNVNNANSNVVSVIPITSNIEKVFAFEVFLSKGTGNLPKDSKAKTNQIRTIDKRRLAKFIGSLPAQYLEQVDIALRLHLDV